MRPPAVKPALQLTNQIGPRAYERWRASRLGSVTETLEQTRILDLIGPVEGRRILDLGCGDGLLTCTSCTATPMRCARIQIRLPSSRRRGTQALMELLTLPGATHFFAFRAPDARARAAEAIERFPERPR